MSAVISVYSWRILFRKQVLNMKVYKLQIGANLFRT